MTRAEPSLVPHWRTVLPAPDRDVFSRAGYGRPGRRGHRPAVLVVDATYQFVGLPLPIRESMATYPSSCGQAAWDAMAGTAAVLQAARQSRVPIFYLAGGAAADVDRYQPRQDKHPAASMQPRDAGVIVDPVRPHNGDVVLSKAKPSAFFGTPLLSLLVYARVDCVVITGGTTSGCIRATATDAFSSGLSAIVVEDATFDRAHLTHAVSLFDLNQKYADVQPSTQVVDYLTSLGAR